MDGGCWFDNVRDSVHSLFFILLATRDLTFDKLFRATFGDVDEEGIYLFSIDIPPFSFWGPNIFRNISSTKTTINFHFQVGGWIGECAW